jgi:predicted exporter
MASGADLETLLVANERLMTRVRRELPGLEVHAPTALLPPADEQRRRRKRIREAVTDVDAVLATIDRAAAMTGFNPHTFDPFAARLPEMVNADLISWEGYRANELQDVIGRFVARTGSDWSIASYAFPATAQEAALLQQAVAGTAGAGVLTGMAIVNAELSARFMPQFMLGLTVGSLIVLASIVATFRSVRLSLLTLLPTVIGLTWAAGLLGLAQVELDLFAIFAVITFIGIGVDYGIHLVHRYQERGNASAATAELAPVILVAGAITLFGYGTLMASSYPPLRSIGIVSVVSVITLVVASVLVLPAMMHRKVS